MGPLLRGLLVIYRSISERLVVFPVLGGHEPKICDAAYDYGRHLGLAFQLIDDALDFKASSAALGKPALADVRLGLATAPVLLAMEQYPELSTLVERYALSHALSHALAQSRARTLQWLDYFSDDGLLGAWQEVCRAGRYGTGAGLG